MANNVFDRMDGIEDQLDELLRRQEEEEQRQQRFREQMSEQMKGKSTRAHSATKSDLAPTDAVRTLVKHSVQEFLWLGTQEQFDKKRRTLIWLLLASIALMTVTSAVATVIFRMYSTYTLFENFCLILLCYLLSHVCHARKEYEANALKYRFYRMLSPDSLGMLCFGGKKLRYKVFFFLGYLGALLNIFCAVGIYALPQGWLILLLELFTWGVTTLTLCLVGRFFFLYEAVLRFSSIKLGMTVFYDTVLQRFFREESFYERMPFMRTSPM